jgi:hypothetical protein
MPAAAAAAAAVFRFSPAFSCATLRLRHSSYAARFAAFDLRQRLLLYAFSFDTSFHFHYDSLAPFSFSRYC